MASAINVYSEIGKLKTVMVKRPGAELENMTPTTMTNFLFDDIPYLKEAQREHDAFTNTLTSQGVNVLELRTMAVQAVANLDEQGKTSFINQIVSESGYPSGQIHDGLTEYLASLATEKLVNTALVGLKKDDIKIKGDGLANLVADGNSLFYLEPMPNLYFTRDPSACIGNGVSISSMTFQARKRETLIYELIYRHHPLFANNSVSFWRTRDSLFNLEGGDELVLNSHVVAVGLSERTEAKAIDELAKQLFTKTQFDTVLAVRIPHNHAMMHLDTVFTMINHDQFTVYPGIMGTDSKIDCYIVQPGSEGQLRIDHQTDLQASLKRVLGESEIDLIPTGNADPIAASREQWNDGSNTLAIAPGKVVTYDRNVVSNELLRKHGVEVLEIPSGELSRGRGGPRCMSCPIYRENID
ncbi:arginine deiminase [Lentilactobacillus sp. Marseille-Q4993]|uniref:arginine deiminase n=1 Tax=Lentilactobacillus sp. Marseille-Q4993 TaxID=3039492 RepID=UPI0024BC1F56|nr:arginine deiminase [Lentilactobacillus sp. Marseille-Q4993]